MKKFLNSKLACIVIPYIFLVLTSIVANIIMFQTPFNTYFYVTLLFISLLVTPIFYMSKKKTIYIYCMIMYFIFTSFTCANTNYYLLFNDVFSLHYFKLISEGRNVVSPKDFKMWAIGLISIVYIIFAIVFPLVIKKKEFTDNNYRNKFHYLAIQSGMFALSLISLNLSITENVSISKGYNYKQVGMMGYYTKEVEQMCSVKKLNISDEYYKEGPQGYLHGQFSGYNVMEICIETAQRMMLNETLTPNLYEMSQHGLLMDCVSKNKTVESEIIGINGSFPSATMLKTDYYTPFSLPSILNEKYNTLYFQETGGKRDIYKETKSMPNIGFENTYFHDDLYGKDRPIWTWSGDYILDSETANKVVDNIINSKERPFYAFYMTLSMHGPYYNTPNDPILNALYGDKLKDAKEKGLWVNPLKNTVNESLIDHYMEACMDFDKALGEICDRLKEANEFDNTLFVLYGDHNIYYNSKTDKSLDYLLANSNTHINYKMYETILLFYNSKFDLSTTKSNFIENEYASPYVIVPTILDLLGYNYYEKFYLGKPLFSYDYKEQVFYSIEMSSFFNSHYWSNDGKSITKIFSNGDKALFIKNMKEVYDKQAFLNKVYDQNLFKKSKYKKNKITENCSS